MSFNTDDDATKARWRMQMARVVETALRNLDAVFADPAALAIFQQQMRSKVEEAISGEEAATETVAALVDVSGTAILATTAVLDWDKHKATEARDRADFVKSVLSNVPRRAQRQDGLTTQLNDLVAVANHLGMYDAADHLRRKG